MEERKSDRRGKKEEVEVSGENARQEIPGVEREVRGSMRQRKIGRCTQNLT